MENEIQEARETLQEARRELRQLESDADGKVEQRLGQAGSDVQSAIQELDGALAAHSS